MPSKVRSTPRCPEFNGLYSSGCRCSFCREQHRRQRNEQRLRDLSRQRGVTHPYDKVDPTEARALILEAAHNGASDREIEKITGVNRSNLYDLRIGTTKYIRRKTHNKIIAALRDNTDVRAFNKGTLVPVGWTRSMIYGLAAQGWPLHQQQDLIATNLKRPAGFIRSATSGKHPTTLYSNEQAMQWLVTQIGDKQGPNKRTARWAARNGYFPCKYYNRHGNLLRSALPKELRQGIESV